MENPPAVAVPDPIPTLPRPVWMQGLSTIARGMGLRRKKAFPLAPSIETVIRTSKRYSNPDDSLLFSWLYLTGQRVSEALDVKRGDVRIREEKGERFMVVDSVTKKNKEQPRREIPVPMDLIEKDMVALVWTAYENYKPEVPLFYYSRQQAFNHLSEVKITCRFIDNKTKQRFEGPLRIYPHFLRHCRATHLASEYGYDLRRLMNYFGWASPAMPNTYQSVDWRDLARGFMG